MAVNWRGKNAEIARKALAEQRERMSNDRIYREIRALFDGTHTRAQAARDANVRRLAIYDVYHHPSLFVRSAWGKAASKEAVSTAGHPAADGRAPTLPETPTQK